MAWGRTHTHTHAHIHSHNESDFKKPGVPAAGWCAPGLKSSLGSETTVTVWRLRGLAKGGHIPPSPFFAPPSKMPELYL